MNLYYNILNSVNSGIVVTDNDHIVKYMDEAAIEHYEKQGGRSLIGRNIFDCHRKESIEKITEYHEKMKKGELDKVLARKSHGVELYMVAIRDENNELIGYAEVFEKPSVKENKTKENSRSKSYKYMEAFNKESTENSIAFLLKTCEEGQEILDINCGTGEIGLQLALKGNNVLAIDSNKNMINCVNEKIVDNIEALNCKYKSKQMDIYDYSKDEKFDILLIDNNYLNFKYTNNRKLELLDKARELLKESGKIIVVVDVPISQNISLFDEKFDKGTVEIGDSRVVKTSEKIKYFEKQKILYYVNSYILIENKSIADSFQETMRRTILSRFDLIGLFEQGDFLVVDHNISYVKDSAFQKEIFVIKNKSTFI